MNWIKKLFVAAAVCIAGFVSTEAQQIYYPKNVVYVAGNYVDKAPKFGTLEAAYNYVLPKAAVGNRWTFWIDCDTLNIDDWDEWVDDAQLLVDSNKATWAGFVLRGKDGLDAIAPQMDTTSLYYAWDKWKSGQSLAWLNQFSSFIDSLDREVERLKVWTKSPITVINDSLTIDADDFATMVEVAVAMALDSVTTVDFIPLDGDTIDYQEGRVYYDVNYKTFTLFDAATGTSLQMSQEFVVWVMNSDTDTLKNGDVCSYDGWNGLYAYARHANAKTDTLSTILAVATHNIPPGTIGKLTVFGAVNGLNTAAYSENNVVYVDTIDGQWTTNKPPAKYNQAPFGFIMRSHATEGIIYAYTGLIPSVSPRTGTATAIDESEGISTTTTPVQITNVGNNLFALKEDVSYGVTQSGDVWYLNEDGIYSTRLDVSFQGGTNITYTLQIAVNGVVSSEYKASRKTSNGDLGFMSFEARGSLEKGDYISFYVSSDASNTFTLVHAVVTIDQLR